ASAVLLAFVWRAVRQGDAVGGRGRMVAVAGRASDAHLPDAASLRGAIAAMRAGLADVLLAGAGRVAGARPGAGVGVGAALHRDAVARARLARRARAVTGKRAADAIVTVSREALTRQGAYGSSGARLEQLGVRQKAVGCGGAARDEDLARSEQ